MFYALVDLWTGDRQDARILQTQSDVRMIQQEALIIIIILNFNCVDTHWQ
jgi:hypothetical protein